MADIEVTVSRIVAEDLDLGTGTVDVPTSDGGTRQGTKINAASIPLKVAGAADSDLTSTNVDDALAEIMGAVDALAADTYSSGEVDTLLAGKSDTGHGHAISDVTGLQTALNGKAAASHTHAQSEITNLSTDLAAKAPLASPTFTGTPKAPTAGAATNDTQIATTAFVKTAIDNHHASTSTDHDDRYYTETEVDTKLGTKADLAGSIAQDFSANGLTVNAATLAAINRIVVSSASIVDAIVYDTSRDSDGGAWRERCAHLSWFNEALQTGRWLGAHSGESAARAAGGVAGDYFYNTGGGVFVTLTGSSGWTYAYRGKTAKFPAIALIVATTTSVTIYDATDPALPMWMVFNGAGANLFRASLTSLAALNGDLLFGQVGLKGVSTARFVADVGHAIDSTSSNLFKGRLADRNSPLGFSVVSTNKIVHADVNDVAATILPGAPIDPATGLPVPTVAVATEGGLCAIKDSGSVVTLDTTFKWKTVDFTTDGRIYAMMTYQSQGDGDSRVFYGPDWGSFTRYNPTDGSLRTLRGNFINPRSNKVAGKVLAHGVDTGLTLIRENPTEPTKGMAAYVTKDYFSGIMPGDIRRAWLASGTAETIAGAELITGDNSTFDTSIGSWVTSNGSAVPSWDASGRMKASKAVAGSWAAVTVPISGLVAGKRYEAVADIDATVGGAGADIQIFGTTEGTIAGNAISAGASGKSVIYFTASGTTGAVNIRLQDNTASNYCLVDNVKVRPAESDRSVKNKGLGVYGSLTKSAVATGAELMGYSGFSATNYLEEPYSADLDFGTGDFCIPIWFKTSNTGNEQSIFRRAQFNGSYVGGGHQQARVTSTGKLEWAVSANDWGTTYSITSDAVVADGAWHFARLVRRGASLEMWIDGAKAASDVSTGGAAINLSNPAATMRIGLRHEGFGAFSGSLALLRAAAYAPTPDQIRAIYEAERHLFTDNAKCLLGGTSNAVQAIAHDPDTDQLYVGTADGVSVFQGLRRVNHLKGAPMTSANIKAIGAARGAVLIGTGAEAVYQEPGRSLRTPDEPFVIPKPSALTPSLKNSWAEYGMGYAPARYWMDSFGVVHLEGLVKSGASGSAIMTLPPGYRPATNRIFPVAMISGGNPALAYVTVENDGDVIMQGATTDWVTLDGIQFRSEQ